MSGISRLELAKPEDVEIVLNVCRGRQAMISRAQNRRTERYLQQVWHATFNHLQGAIVEHIELKRKVYCKCGHDGRLLNGCLQANVALREDLEIYVEMRIEIDQIVILAAHNHDTSNHLPQ